MSWILLGGPVLWVLVVLSVPVFALVAERSTRSVRERRRLMVFLKEAEPLASRGEVEALRALARRSGGVGGTLMEAVWRGGDAEGARALAAAAGAPWVEAQGRGLAFLGLAASVGPLLGLLGTVMGLITMFREIQDAPPGVDLLPLAAGGLWEAMLTTVAGLVVAIPAASAHQLLGAVRDQMVSRAEAWVERLVALKEVSRAPKTLAAPRGEPARRP
ncbi:MAG: MotA/TolQ/ExbB proton channel family protein [Planctomycetes bacterium]|nr:MotA/TolQ/ExbB proton channel family protein [Planctomycetota bacterium]